MTFLRWGELSSLGAGLLVLACGGGGGGGMGPCTPGTATQLVKSGGDAQAWYFNNPLPATLTVTARDASGCAVPGTVVTWAVASGDGAVSPAQSTTNASGVAATADSLGSASSQSVTATFSGLPTPATFTATASAPPTTAAVTVMNNDFSPNDVAIQVGGTVTWTWNSGGVEHNVTYNSPNVAAGRTNSLTQGSGTHVNTITSLGRFGYSCTIHAGMSGTVAVVH